MFIIIGTIIVFGSVMGGYIMHGGQPMVLMQISEFIIIGGAGIGSLLIATPLPVLKDMISQLLSSMGSGYSKKDYVDQMVMLYEVFNIARREGLVGLESHIEHPKDSDVISRYPSFIKNHHAVDFMSDTMRLIITGSVQPHELEALLDIDLETHHEDVGKGPTALATMADAFPGLGIVAAVLGVVITMGAIGGPAEEIGHKVGAALVGTFLGVLLCYGFVGPLANAMKARNQEDAAYMKCLQQCLLAFCKGFPPSIAVEYGRRSIHAEVRPGFTELEDACKNTRKS